ncbi:MAG: SIR2 family protein, partial [Armatimonadota bacterium]
MSYSADTDGGNRLSTPALSERLKVKLRELSLRGIIPANLKERIESPQLSELAELLWHYYGLEAAVKALGLENWSEIQPTRAHRYLAMLVRERLFSEVLTTNYDCLVESALTQSAAPAVPSRDWPRPRPIQIRSLDEYRQHGGERGDHRTVLLHTIKLNGCADEYADALDRLSEDPANEDPANVKKREHYDRVLHSIAITERQLQDWRKCAWLEHLFRDRARTRRLLFVGFGSEDPMVRHTMMQVAEEFADGGAARSGDDEDIEAKCPPCQRHNAPFIAEKGPLQQAQRQVLAGFCLAQHCGQRKQKKYASGGLEVGIRANACAQDWDDGQPADEFWGELYLRSIRRLLLEKYLSEDSPLARYLAPLLHSADNVLAATRGVLTGARSDCASPVRSFWDAFALNLQLGSRGISQLGLAHLSAAGAQGMEQDGHYVAFADEPVGLPMMYMLWVLLHNAVRLNKGEVADPLRLELPTAFPEPSASGVCIGELSTGTRHEQPRKVYCRFGDPGMDLAQPVGGTAEEGNHLLVITLDGRRRRPRRIVR